MSLQQPNFEEIIGSGSSSGIENNKVVDGGEGEQQPGGGGDIYLPQMQMDLSAELNNIQQTITTTMPGQNKRKRQLKQQQQTGG